MRALRVGARRRDRARPRRCPCAPRERRGTPPARSRRTCAARTGLAERRRPTRSTACRRRALEARERESPRDRRCRRRGRAGRATRGRQSGRCSASRGARAPAARPSASGGAAVAVGRRRTSGLVGRPRRRDDRDAAEHHRAEPREQREQRRAGSATDVVGREAPPRLPGAEGRLERDRRRPRSPRTTDIGAREISGTDVMPAIERSARSCRIDLARPTATGTGVDRRAR